MFSLRPLRISSRTLRSKAFDRQDPKELPQSNPARYRPYRQSDEHFNTALVQND
jgi:hypothetical protein